MIKYFLGKYPIGMEKSGNVDGSTASNNIFKKKKSAMFTATQKCNASSSWKIRKRSKQRSK
jgi:hypothetical protein